MGQAPHRAGGNRQNLEFYIQEIPGVPPTTLTYTVLHIRCMLLFLHCDHANGQPGGGPAGEVSTKYIV